MNLISFSVLCMRMETLLLYTSKLMTSVLIQTRSAMGHTLSSKQRLSLGFIGIFPSNDPYSLLSVGFFLWISGVFKIRDGLSWFSWTSTFDPYSRMIIQVEQCPLDAAWNKAVNPLWSVSSIWTYFVTYE